MPLLGARELGHGALLLGSRRPASWVWTRVAGDVLDLILLVRALCTRTGDRRRRTAVSTAAVVGITAVDLCAAVRSIRRSGAERSGTTHMNASHTANRPRNEV